MARKIESIADEVFPVNLIIDLFKKKRHHKKKVLILEGGAMRGIFTCGVLTAFHDRNYFPWQLIIGSSAGAINGSAYAAGQIHLSRDAYFTELLSGDFISLRNILRPKKHILNLDWMVKNIVLGEEPLDQLALRKSCPVFITGTHIPENEPPRTIYLSTKRDDIISSLKATAALPYLYRGFVDYDGYQLLDGGILDPIPYKKALDMGYKEDEILVIVTRQKGYRKKEESFWIKTLFELYYRDPKYHYLVDVLEFRYKKYNSILNELETNHPGIDIIYPPKNYTVDNLSRDRAQMLTGFTQGLASGKNYLKKMKKL
jgi:predicted patatin/cPLA2 family phospholipase